MAFLWDFIKIPPRAEHITAFIIHSRTRFPLWRLKLATVNIKGTNTHKHLVDSRQGKIKYTADAIIELRALITCNWPYTDLSDSTKLLTVLITICYWIPRPPHTIRMRGAELALHIIRLSGHIPPVNCRDLTLCLSGLSWIYQSAEAKLSPPLSGNMKSRKKDEVTSKLCYIRCYFYNCG